MLAGQMRIGFGLTEPEHGSDATWMETTAVRDGSDWVINGAKRFNSGMHTATHDVVFDHWGDGSNVRPLAASVGSSLDAWYSCTNGCGGGP